MKTCTKCGEEKPLDGFQRYWHKGHGKHQYAGKCRPCRNTDRRTPEILARSAEQRRAAYASDPAYRTARQNVQRKWRYGIDNEEYAALLESQGGSCAICRTDTPGGHGAFHVDHDHSCCPGLRSCGRCIRGLLCHHCNLLLGHAKDDTNLLMDAIDYLRGERDV